MNKYLCIIQARTRSTRLPKKVLLKVDGLTILEHVIERARQSKKIDKIVVATGEGRFNDAIAKICEKARVDCFRGSEEDVLGRYYACSMENPEFNYIIRLTADDPLIDPLVVDDLINFSEKNQKFDYASNNIVRTFPYGLDVEIFKKEVLAEAAKKAKLTSEREHMTLYIKNNKRFKKGNFSSNVDFSHFRFTVDEKEDFEVIKFIIRNSKEGDGYLDHISLLTKNPKIMLKNMYIAQDVGLMKSLKNDFKFKQSSISK